MSDRLGSLFFAAIAQANTPRVERTERLDGSQTSPRRSETPDGAKSGSPPGRWAYHQPEFPRRTKPLTCVKNQLKPATARNWLVDE